MPDTLTKAAYQTFQEGKKYFGVAHKALSTQLLNVLSGTQREEPNPPNPQLLLLMQGKIDALLEADWQDAEDGIYPKQALFENRWDDFFRYYPEMWLDLPKIWDRASNKRHQEFDDGIDTSGYPSYYVQNFHHQTDGYFSDSSARMYDLQVEVLFNGTAAPMRRRILAPLKQHLAQMETPIGDTPQSVKILDIACGTGNSLIWINQAIPQAALYGVDLSPAYIRKANENLSDIKSKVPAQLIQANAEALPFVDEFFEATTSTFLFHELPAEARQNVINEAFRVTKPGGVFVICDSIQKIDVPEFEPLMENFPAMFHEPYYRHYIGDDLVARLESAGFTDVTTANHFMSKYWVALKPTV
ncbi:Methyltransferase domain family [Synechococcus sp. PCC 7335]|uniref:class I SAM-dependent methyltransferase n=1 Tax=Synechococcus sp. (strain ATCC 29403 / PCC 7335) TaxID=91464 RepID=UPI00017EB0A9|nr:class I SAM-dependent methyltransferase [Synechococcus sp. PCC 7335]EDX85717.1 Methyltransferase domain family [Synechococcus sp. PCC 7335]